MKIALFAAAIAVIAGTIFFATPPRPKCTDNVLTSQLACEFIKGETTK
jgi:hypothetical protein